MWWRRWCSCTSANVRASSNGPRRREREPTSIELARSSNAIARGQATTRSANLRLLVGIPIPTHFINIYDHSQGVFFPLFRLYEYHLSSDGTTYDLFAVGPDGVPHTADDIRPDLPDSLSRRSGYRPAEGRKP